MAFHWLVPVLLATLIQTVHANSRNSPNLFAGGVLIVVVFVFIVLGTILIVKSRKRPPRNGNVIVGAPPGAIFSGVPVAPHRQPQQPPPPLFLPTNGYQMGAFNPANPPSLAFHPRTQFGSPAQPVMGIPLASTDNQPPAPQPQAWPPALMPQGNGGSNPPAPTPPPTASPPQGTPGGRRSQLPQSGPPPAQPPAGHQAPSGSSFVLEDDGLVIEESDLSAPASQGIEPLSPTPAGSPDH